MTGRDFHEEEKLGRAIDLPIIKRLLKFARPYKLVIALCVFLILILTGLALMMPLIYRKAVNDNIVSTHQMLDISATTPETRQMLQDEARDKLLNVDENRKLISDRDFKSLDPALNKKLVDEKAVTDPYFVFVLDDYPHNRQTEMRGVIDSHSDIFSKSENFYYVAYSDVFIKRKLSTVELTILRKEDISGIKLLALAFGGLLILNFIFMYFQYHLSQYVGQRIIMDIRMKLFSHIESLSLKFFDSNPVGRLVTRVTNDIEVLNQAFINILINLFKDIFLLIGIIAMMLWLNWELALVTFCILPVLIWTTFYFRKKVREAFREVRLKIARINATIAEHLAGMSVVQLFHRENAAHDHFKTLNHDYFNANMRQVKIFAIFRPIVSSFQSLAIALLVWYGGGEIIRGSINLGDLWAFFFYLRMFFEPINELSQKYNELQQAMASSERVFMLMDQKDTISEPSTPKALNSLKGDIEFQNVWFAYKDEEYVLKDISFKVRPGEKVALVGATGAGKSSIISLLSRFYDLTKGRILVDGIDVRDVKKSELRSHIAVVMQDVFIFSGDIKSNIRLNEGRITMERVYEAASLARANAFIERLPQRYDHAVMERGATFSQGERQLLSFARAVAFDPKIFVLDEATANIDTETEILIQQAIDNLMKNRTSIVIAHRLSTVRNVDRIIVLDKGRIAEEGSHQELLKKKGLYFKLYQLQYKDQGAAEQLLSQT